MFDAFLSLSLANGRQNYTPKNECVHGWFRIFLIGAGGKTLSSSFDTVQVRPYIFYIGERHI